MESEIKLIRNATKHNEVQVIREVVRDITKEVFREVTRKVTRIKTEFCSCFK